MQMKQIFIFILMLGIIGLANKTHAQQVIVTDDAAYTTPAAGSMLDVKSTTKGFIVPRMTTAQRTTLGGTTPVNGIVVYDTDLKSFWYWENSIWNQIAASGLPLTGIKFGDAANYSTFEADGTLLMVGNATVWTDLMVYPDATTRGGSNAPVWGGASPAAFKKNAGGTSQGVFLWMFSATVEQELYFTVQIPHSYKLGTTLYPHVHWTTATGTPSGTDVVWGLEYSVISIAGSFPTTTTLTANSVISLIATPSGTGQHLITALGTISGSGLGISSILVCRLYRAATNGSDTFANETGLLGFDIHYEQDTQGSRQEFIK
jgi:hypothetical protein